MPESAFTSKFGQPARSDERRKEYDWAHQECRDDEWYAWYARITLISSAVGTLEEIRWEHQSD
jgi:hypothetical protein